MLSTEALNCGNGFTCLGGTMSSEPTANQNGGICPDKFYCSVLEVGPQGCDSGYYQPNLAQSSCLACPAGLLCTDTDYSGTLCQNPLYAVDTDCTGDATYSYVTPATRPVECPEGYYCPAQTVIVNNEEVPCDPGYYSAISAAGSVEDCIECPVGKYCVGAKD